MSLVRWSYLVPRVIIVMSLFLAVRLGTDPLTRWCLVRASQRVNGAKVDVGRVRLQLSRGMLRVMDVQIADPDEPDRNRLQFDEAILQVDRGAFLRRRVVVRQGRVSGLAVGTERETSGRLERPEVNEPTQDEDAARSGWQQKASETASDWAADFQQRLHTDAARQLQSVKLAEGLNERWPREYHQLNKQVDQWRVRVERWESIARNPGGQLQGIDDFRRLLDDARQLKQQIPILKNEYARLRQQVAVDRDAIATASRRDAAWVREHLRWNDLDPQQLTDYLLGPVLSSRWETLSAWLQRGRQAMSLVAGRPGINRGGGRGTTYSFLDEVIGPGLWVQKLAIDGAWHVEGADRPFRGLLTNICSDADRCDDPTRIKLSFEGEQPWHVVAEVDRRNEQRYERIQVQLPSLVLPKQTLGDRERLAWQLQSGEGQGWIDLHFTRGHMQGRMMVVQHDVAIEPQVGNRWSGTALQDRLSSATEQLNQFQVVANVEGSLRAPSWQLESNLGQQLASATNQALREELEGRGQQLLAEAQTRIAEQQAQVDELVQTQEARFEQLIQSLSGRLTEYQSSLLPSFPWR